MKILFLDQYGEPGGAQQCLLDLIPAIVGRGWGAVCAVPEGPLGALLAEAGAHVSHIDAGRYGSGRKSAGDVLRFAGRLGAMTRELRALRRRCCPDLIYVNGPRLLPAAVLCREGTPLMFHAHHFVSQTAVRNLVARSLNWTGAEVIAVSEMVADSLRGFVPDGRISMIRNGVPDFLRPRKPDPHFRIGIVGRIAPEKGQDVFVEMARILAAQEPELRFFIAGEPLFSKPGYAERVRARAEGLPIEFLGWCADVAGVYAELDLLVAPSVGSDAAPRCVIEAFSAGVPVVAFPTGGIPELIRDGEDGFLVREGTAEALAARVGNLIRDRRSLEIVAENARLKWSREFSLERYRADVIAAILRATGMQSDPRPAMPTERLRKEPESSRLS